MTTYILLLRTQKKSCAFSLLVLILLMLPLAGCSNEQDAEADRSASKNVANAASPQEAYNLLHTFRDRFVKGEDYLVLCSSTLAKEKIDAIATHLVTAQIGYAGAPAGDDIYKAITGKNKNLAKNEMLVPFYGKNAMPSSYRSSGAGFAIVTKTGSTYIITQLEFSPLLNI